MKSFIWYVAGIFLCTVHSQDPCPIGFTQNGDKCFKAYTQAKSWSDAMTFCEGVADSLATIENEDDTLTVAGLVQGIQAADALSLNTGNDYLYHYMADQGLDVTNTDFITFEVMTCNDAHIALSQVKGVDRKQTYEIVIGGWADSQSVIRTYKQGPHMATAAHQNHPVDCHKYLPFWISWTSGTISVGKGSTVGQNMFMSWHDPRPHPVNYVAFATGFGSTGKWRFNSGSVPAKFWIGGSNEGSSHEWQWSPSMSNFTYINWAPSQPNMANAKHCLLLDPSQNNKWLNEACDATHYFVCQVAAQNVIIG